MEKEVVFSLLPCVLQHELGILYRLHRLQMIIQAAMSTIQRRSLWFPLQGEETQQRVWVTPLNTNQNKYAKVSKFWDAS